MSPSRLMTGLGAGVLLFALAACAGARAAPIPMPRDVPWYNVSRPLAWSDLAGRAVLLDFFTPGCINCVHMLPVEAKLAKHFGKRGVIVAAHLLDGKVSKVRPWPLKGLEAPACSATHATSASTDLQ